MQFSLIISKEVYNIVCTNLKCNNYVALIFFGNEHNRFSISLCPTNVLFFFQVVFNVANELLKTANQNPRLALHKAKAGWILLGALMTLGEKFV